MRDSENWIVNFVVFLATALVYALANASKYMSDVYSSMGEFKTIFASSLVLIFVSVSTIYGILSLTKLSKYIKVIISGFSAPIILNLFSAIFYNVSLKDLYPTAFFDSIIIMFLLAGGFYIASKIGGKRK